MIKLLLQAIFVAAALFSYAPADDNCGIPGSILQGNRLSDKTLASFIKRPDLFGAPDTQKPSDYVSVSLYGAVGDGNQDDTDELQAALNQAKRVWLEPSKVYRITKRLNLRDGMSLASDGTATILMARGESGFSNTKPDRDEEGIYRSAGTGIIAQGNTIILKDFFLVKEYEDTVKIDNKEYNRYVIGIEIRSSDGVLINRLRLRGFSLAPGIITIRSSKNVEIFNSIIHASCTRSNNVPEKKHWGSFQITGISVDDSRINNKDSEHIKISNNVINDLFMKPVSFRGDQTDGINYHANRTGDHITIENNYVNNVAEGIDIFGANILLRGNTLGGRELGIKLIHGARHIRIWSNLITGKMSVSGIGMFTAAEEEEDRQVRNISVRDNFIDMRSTSRPGVYVDHSGKYPPIDIMVEENRFLVNSCDFAALICDGNKCKERNNEKLHEGVFPCP